WRAPSREAGGAEELARLSDEGAIREPRGFRLVEALGEGQDGVVRVAARGEQLAPALLAVDEDDEVADDKSGLLERLDRLELARAIGDDVVDHDDALPRPVKALDLFPSAVTT